MRHRQGKTDGEFRAGGENALSKEELKRVHGGLQIDVQGTLPPKESAGGLTQLIVGEAAEPAKYAPKKVR